MVSLNTWVLHGFRNKLRWLRPSLAAVILLTLLAGVSGCSGGSANAAPVKAQWVQALPEGDSVLLSLADLERYTNVHFKVVQDGNAGAFMAYRSDDEIHVRANVCPPCRSQGFSLAGDDLVCDSCGTIFKAIDGGGVQGACVDFPKAAVNYSVNGDSLLMTKNDLFRAYQDTLSPGLP